MARRGTIRNTGRVARELAEARRERAKSKQAGRLTPAEEGILAAKADARKREEEATADAPTHLDYAEEAEAAERAEAWPQAAALWRKAVECWPEPLCDPASLERDRYLARIAECDRQHRLEEVLEGIAQSKLRIPTLRTQHSDRRDFHDLAVWTIRRALLAAYEAGRADAK